VQFVAASPGPSELRTLLVVEACRKEAAMKRYAGIELSMKTTHVCVVDADGRIGAICVDSTLKAIASALER